MNPAFERFSLVGWDKVALDRWPTKFDARWHNWGACAQSGWSHPTSCLNCDVTLTSGVAGNQTATLMTIFRTAEGWSLNATPGMWPSLGKKIVKLPAGTVTKLPGPSKSA